MKLFLSVTELHKVTGVSRVTIYKYINEGILKTDAQGKIYLEGKLTDTGEIDLDIPKKDMIND